MYSMMYDANFTYDSSMPIYEEQCYTITATSPLHKTSPDSLLDTIVKGESDKTSLQTFFMGKISKYSVVLFMNYGS